MLTLTSDSCLGCTQPTCASAGASPQQMPPATSHLQSAQRLTLTAQPTVAWLLTALARLTFRPACHATCSPAYILPCRLQPSVHSGLQAGDFMSSACSAHRDLVASCALAAPAPVQPAMPAAAQHAYWPAAQSPSKPRLCLPGLVIATLPAAFPQQMQPATTRPQPTRSTTSTAQPTMIWLLA